MHHELRGKYVAMRASAGARLHEHQRINETIPVGHCLIERL